MNRNDKIKLALAVVGGITVSYYGLRTVAVAMDPEVHKAVGQAAKAISTGVGQAAKRAAAAPTVKTSR